MKAKNPEPQTFVYFCDKIGFQEILPPPLVFGCCLKKTLNHKQLFSSMIKHSFQEFCPIIFRSSFFFVACYIQTSKTQNQRQSFISVKKKISFKEFHSPFFFSFFGVASIFRLQREHSCDCVLTDTSLWSLSQRSSI